MASELPIVTRLRSSICENKCKAMLASSGCDCAEAADIITELVDALRWYAEQVAGCKIIHSGGNVFRNALAADGGQRAAAALAKAGGPINE